MKLLAPCSGRVIPIAEVDDPVFAEGMLGPGVAIEPLLEPTTVVSPISGTIVKVHPHAFVVLNAEEQLGVLVHLGINTVKLEGKGFEVLAAQGDTVEAGDPMVTWNPADITGEGETAGMLRTVPVVLLDQPADLAIARAHEVTAGEILFEVGNAT